jgi:uncharacterized repeat protein (TIGR01451 family)
MMRICPKCGDYYADALLAFCLVDGTPLMNVAPTGKSWREGARVIEKKENALSRQKRNLKWRRIALSAMLVATMVVCVVAANSFIYIESTQKKNPLPGPSIQAIVPDVLTATAITPITQGKPIPTPTPTPITTPDTTIPVKKIDTPPPTPSADLVLANSDSPDLVAPGGELAYTITISNNGPSAAQSITVTDNLPSSVTFVNCAANKGGVCKGAGDKRTIFFASLDKGALATITLHTTASNSLTNGAIIENTASVTSNTSDPRAGNNSDNEITTVRIAAPVCSDKDESREGEIIKKVWSLNIGSERSEIIREYFPVDLQGVNASFRVIEYQTTFSKPCQAAVVTVKYEWHITAQAIKIRPIQKEKKFNCVKNRETWVCR